MERSLSPRAAVPARAPGRAALACLALALLVAGAEAVRWTRGARAAAAPAPALAIVPGQAVLSELSRSLVPMPRNTPSAHASALATLPGDRMVTFWWAGSRESGPDVKVYASQWDGGKWGAAWEVASRESLGKALGFGVRRLGNPVAWTSRDGKVHLYVVATGLGGWAASRVVHMVSSTQGASFEVRRVLPMSPLFNTSVLVRTSAVGLADGGWWLPVYFELGIKYPMLMSFDAAGEPTGLARIGSRTTTLQPAIVPVSHSEVRAWMRDASDERRVQHAMSRDGGASWQDLPALDLHNENTSVATIRLANGEFLMLHNDQVKGGSSRSTLRLSMSKDGHAWRKVADVASGSAGDEFSYPTMQQVGSELHVTYTHQRRAIAHHRYRISIGEKI
ncbi:exo-alpha-sialidase [Telluria aromaticivorans]|uniref:Exo-alpha-sialidase n=1 Tax=Telluria aromaticivorans TaxID=2725995 RepID=A0A7Y2JW73_9BURK|nr:sialidase family protein [Telluria aromaticivorans]NNG21700.1 exo-alpha-sialidase [Telluria aromaticivorans]